MRTARKRRLATRLVPIAVLALIAGCSDESEPSTWLKRLPDPKKRPEAVKHLAMIYDDDLAKANRNREDPAVKAVADAIVEPLTERYMSGDLDDDSRSAAIWLIAETHDPRGFPALARALSTYEPGKSDDDATVAAKAIREMATDGKPIEPTLIQALEDCFLKFRPSKARSAELAKELSAAVPAVKAGVLGGACANLLAVPVDATHPADGDRIGFTERTCVQVVKDLAYVGAVRPLVSALLIPARKPLASDVTAALETMPLAAQQALSTAITGTDPDFASLEFPLPQRSYIQLLAPSLGYTGGRLAGDAAVAALGVSDNDANRLAVAKTLDYFPPNARAVGTFEAAYTSIAKGASDPELGGNVHARFLEQAPKLYDAHVTAWLLKQVAAADPGDRDAVAPAGLRAAILLMAPHEAPAVAAAVKKYGAPEQAELAKAATVVTDKCATTLDCYVGVLDETAGGGTAGVAALKAGMMLGMFGNDQIRGELVKRVERLKDREVREAVLFAILRLAPNGDKPAAGVLEKLAKSEQGKSPEETQLLTRVAMILKTRI